MKKNTDISLRPSCASQWAFCPYSATMNHFIKEEVSQEIKNTQMSGTKAHALAEICIKNKTSPFEYLDKTITFTTTENGEEIEVTEYVSDETTNIVSGYLDYIKSFLKKGMEWGVENKVDLTDWINNGSGTCDFYTLDREEGVLHICDLKTGRVQVSAKDNMQLQLYALGVLKKVQTPEKVKKVKLHIYQPKAKNSCWELGIEHLTQIFGDFIRERADQCLVENPLKIAGNKQCQYCPGKHVCDENYKSRISPVLETALNHADNKDEMPISVEMRARIIENKKDIVEFLDKVTEDTLEKMKGKSLFMKGYKIKKGNKVRFFNENAPAFLIMFFGEEAYTKKFIGITEAEKKAKDSALEKLPDHIISHKYNKDSIVKVDCNN